MENLTDHPLRFASLVIVLLLPIHFFLPRDLSVTVSAVILVLIAGVYLGFAALDGRVSAVMTETIGAVIFAAGAVVGLSSWPLAIPIALFAHAGWDMLHHRAGFGAAVPVWYVPFCAVIDIVVGGGLIALYLFRGI